MLLLLLSFALSTPAFSDEKFATEMGKISSEYIFKNPVDFKNETYCYFVFQGVVNARVINPTLYAKYVKGSTLSNSGLSQYVEWLDTKDGRHCKKSVGRKFRPVTANRTKTYSIFLNEKTIQADGESLETTLNHERLHVLFATRKADRKKIEDAWAKVSDKEKSAFEKKHPGYDYTNPDIALREYFSYTYESAPEDALKLLTK